MKVFLGEISVPLSYGELNSLIINHAEWLAKYANNSIHDPNYFQQKLDRINFLVAKLKEFEAAAASNAGENNG
jgi:hypothetical protein